MRRRPRLRGQQSLLRLPGMRALVAADVMSDLGSAVAVLAVAYISYRDSRSMVTTVLVAASYSLPAAAVGLWAGRLADSADRRHVIIASYLGTMAVWTGVLVLAATDWLNPYWLMLTSAAAGVMSALRYPSWHEFVKDLVPEERLAEANGLFSSLGAIATLVGAIAGGLVITGVGENAIFIFNVVSYVPLIAVIGTIPPPRQVFRSDVPRRHLRQTIAYARSTPALRATITIVAVLSLLAVPIAQLLPAMATEFGSEAHYLGLLTAFYFLGASLVAAALHRVKDDYPRFRLVDRTALTCGSAMIVVGLIGATLGEPGRRAAVIALLVPIGLGVSMVQAVLSATVQLSASAEMEGRVIALYGMTVSLIVPVGALTFAEISDISSVWVAVGVAGVLLLIAGLGMRAHPPASAARASGAEAHSAAIQHAHHLGRHVPGAVHPGQSHPLTVRSGRDDPSARPG